MFGFWGEGHASRTGDPKVPSSNSKPETAHAVIHMTTVRYVANQDLKQKQLKITLGPAHLARVGALLPVAVTQQRRERCA